MTIIVSFDFVAASTLLLGLPVTGVLRKLDWESEEVYVLAGGVLGFLIPGTILAVAEGGIDLFLEALPAGLLGAISGAMTGRTWWRQYRAAVVENYLPRF